MSAAPPAPLRDRRRRRRRHHDELVDRLLANPIIERWSHGTVEPTFADRRCDRRHRVVILEVDGLDDDALAALNRERGLSLDPAELQAIADHFAPLGREPTDVELETLAQTWSEHCAHKTFRARITEPTTATRDRRR